MLPVRASAKYAALQIGILKLLVNYRIWYIMKRAKLTISFRDQHYQFMKKSKTNTSFEKLRRAFLDRIVKGSWGSVVRRTIPFSNDDVPQFLKRLDAFESISSRSRFVAR